jgi:hypothetical protein
MIVRPNALPTIQPPSDMHRIPTLDSGRIANARKLLRPRDATLSGTMVDEPRRVRQASACESKIAVVSKALT